MKQHPTDLSLLDLHQRVAPACALSLEGLLALDFSPHDYISETCRYWRAETVRQAVITITRGEFVARPSELHELAQFVHLLRRAGGKTELSEAEAIEAALQHATTGRLKKIFDRWPPSV